MATRRTTIDEDVDNARRLEEHARNVMATNQRQEQRSWYDPGCKWSIFGLAVLGMITLLVASGMIAWPLLLVSLKFWGI